MADYESDSSGGGDVQTNVLLGYASKEPTGDEFSQLGGHPAWLDSSRLPDAVFAICRVCNGYLSLLLQLNADLPDRFPGHERRIYVWACRHKPCRRKNESIRAFRAVRGNTIEKKIAITADEHSTSNTASVEAGKVSMKNLGEAIFGGKAMPAHNANPFALPCSSSNDVPNPFSSSNDVPNPFSSSASTSDHVSTPPVTMETLPETFAQKARISSSQAPSTFVPRKARQPWPEHSAFTSAFLPYYIDADSEYLESDPMIIPLNARVGGGTLESEGSNGGLDEKSLFESSMDKTFQRFADRLAQNPKQVLRYEYGGNALLYSKKDAVGKILASEQESSNAKVKIVSRAASSSVPRCANCGAGRVFELQLTPHAILELEAEDTSIDGMDWGTIIVGVCSADCQEKDINAGEVGYVEEWIGVQWEELAGKGR